VIFSKKIFSFFWGGRMAWEVLEYTKSLKALLPNLLHVLAIIRLLSTDETTNHVVTAALAIMYQSFWRLISWSAVCVTRVCALSKKITNRNEHYNNIIRSRFYKKYINLLYTSLNVQKKVLVWIYIIIKWCGIIYYMGSTSLSLYKNIIFLNDKEEVTDMHEIHIGNRHDM
jgi:hypothetical protein